MGKTASVIKGLKSFGFKIREARELRHLNEQVEKEMRRNYDSVKSKHTVPKRFDKGHKAWSINGEET